MENKILHFIWMLDCSGSMTGEKIQSLNYAIRNALPGIIDIAEKNKDIEIFMRIIKFSDGAQWLTEKPVELDKFIWSDLQTGGITDLGAALDMVNEELSKLDKKTNLPPVIILVTDGQPTDNYEEGLRKLLSSEIGSQSVRIAIAIGEDVDNDILEDFIGNNDEKPLQAGNSDSLINLIKWSSINAVDKSFQQVKEYSCDDDEIW
ncbi:VWA domain-containing protein [Clostridium sp. CX1]|uniref:vWA domain-containing protein n=1 Tax=Clostridium sp. CX1 TaxID=2978346 RepID=UPI0021C1F785|nr:VWA domain-containing protein [Clostridium sp. CX1]MCT8977732.1 VWA domain-containing protein [Clostridium sp. CX1]